eukprot:2822434-Amphidinium_carterae.1
MGGHWAVSWALTGVADPEPSSSLHSGLATPLEVATAIAFVKDTRVLEEASKKASSGAGSSNEGNQYYGQGSGRGQ